jgi:hypothetical protein
MGLFAQPPGGGFSPGMFRPFDETLDTPDFAFKPVVIFRGPLSHDGLVDRRIRSPFGATKSIHQMGDLLRLNRAGLRVDQRSWRSVAAKWCRISMPSFLKQKNYEHSIHAVRSGDTALCSGEMAERLKSADFTG